MELLLEILVEELPAAHLRTGLEQIREKLSAWLPEGGIAVHAIETFGTPRRLIVAADVAPGEADREEVVTGPPKAAAFMPDGSFSRAAQGFARSQGVAVESLQVMTTARGEYVGYRRFRKGRTAADVLRDVLPRVLSSLSFPKTMRWGTGSFRFSRPIHNILCLVGGEPLGGPAFEGLIPNDLTWGHRILAPGEIRVRGREDYRERLREARVIVDRGERRAMIEAGIRAVLDPQGARLYPDPELLETLVDNVEHPLVVCGAFPESYLELPIEILATAMREGQKVLSVVRDGRQLPGFVGVADAAADEQGLIRRGNERVLKARLEDARFFWERDEAVPLAERARELAGVIFQAELGTYADKARRLEALAAYLCDRTGVAPKAETSAAAGLCKADLVTEMVKEFPSLQGRVGGLYARREGYPPEIHQPIYEHYRPVGLEDESPSSAGGALLSIADKLDSIVGAVGLGVRVTGSSDPLGLRRNAHGVCKVILDRGLRLPFPALLDEALAAYGGRLAATAVETKDYALDFFSGRLRFMLERRGIRYDLVGAALGAGLDDILLAARRAESLDSLSSSPDFEPFILMAKRVNNILRDQPSQGLPEPALFTEKEERKLQDAFSAVREEAAPLLAAGDFIRAQSAILRLRPDLNAFFDAVLVMAEDPALRRNRLALLQAVQELLRKVADYGQVVVEGERPPRPGASR